MAVRQIVDESEYAYQTLIASYPAGSVRLLKAIAHAGVVPEINSGDFIARYRLKATSSVNAAIKNLLKKEMVYKTPKGYVVYDRFLSIWLRSQPF